MIERRVLRWAFCIDDFPSFKCPECHAGDLALQEPIAPFHPEFSKRMQSEVWADIDHISLRLNGEMICLNRECGQIVGFSADGAVSEEPDNYGNLEYCEYFYFKFFYPAPNIIDLPQNLPAEIRSPLKSAFAVFWSQKQLASNATRQALENLLDLHGVPRSSEKGKRLTFAGRIDRLRSAHPKYAELFELSLPLLNAGSHGEIVSTDTLIDIFEALEIHISLVFDSRTTRLAELQENLKMANTKGNI